MAMVSEQRSALNPNAPLFIPTSFRQVEDFSPKWWELVKTSTWFRDYWINQHQDDDFSGNVENVTKEDDFPSLDAEFEELVFSSEAEHFIDEADKTQNGVNLDAKALLKILSSPKPSAEPPRTKHHEKPAQHVSVRCASRRIQQPR